MAEVSIRTDKSEAEHFVAPTDLSQPNIEILSSNGVSYLVLSFLTSTRHLLMRDVSCIMTIS